MKIHHINCGYLHAPPNPKVGCHCLVVESSGRLLLVDTGIGLHDVADPEKRIGKAIIEMAGFQFEQDNTAAYQIQSLGFGLSDVSDIVLTHADPDHAGGLADFPHAKVHVSMEEHRALQSNNPRYVSPQFSHQPRWVIHEPCSELWFGLEARQVRFDPKLEILLIPLFGHTLGHCGIAIKQDEQWILHVGDAYYLKEEIPVIDHPVAELAATSSDNNDARLESLEQLRRLQRDHGDTITMFGYHDFSEFEAFCPQKT